MSSRRNTWLALLLIAGFVALLVWGTLGAQAVECEVCVRFAGTENCATASAATEAEARRSAQTTACGPLTRGMNDAIACDNTPPVSRRCVTR
jgi:hypothetical protein